MQRRRPVRLEWDDALLLAILLWEVDPDWQTTPGTFEVGMYGVDDRPVPDFERVTFGLPRLEAAGLVSLECGVDGAIRVVPTERALEVKGRASGHRDQVALVDEVQRAIGARSSAPGGPPEDRSLGALPRYTQADFDRDAAAYREATDPLDRGEERLPPVEQLRRQLGRMGLPETKIEELIRDIESRSPTDRRRRSRRP